MWAFSITATSTQVSTVHYKRGRRLHSCLCISWMHVLAKELVCVRVCYYLRSRCMIYLQLSFLHPRNQSWPCQCTCRQIHKLSKVGASTNFEVLTKLMKFKALTGHTTQHVIQKSIGYHGCLWPHRSKQVPIIFLKWLVHGPMKMVGRPWSAPWCINFRAYPISAVCVCVCVCVCAEVGPL